MEQTEIKKEVKGFITENFLLNSKEQLDDMASFMETGVLDSTGILELIGFIEETFDIEVDDEEMIPENLDGIFNVVSYVQKKLN